MLLKTVVSLLLLTGSSLAKDLGTVAHTFEIHEQNLLEVIQSKLNALEQSGQMAGHQQQVQQQVKKSIERPRPVAGLTVATRYASKLYDPSFVLDADIKDHVGNMIGQKGTKYNPLDQLSFGQPLLFIDGDDAAQVQWALAQSGNPVLVNGAPLALAQTHGRHFYFDQGGALVRKFGIEEVPAKVSQQGKHLLIETMPPTLSPQLISKE